MAESSQRADAIDAHPRRAVDSFVAAHSRAPSPVEQMRIRQASTLATRPDKSHRSLAELSAGGDSGPTVTCPTGLRWRSWRPCRDATTCPACAPTTWMTPSSPTPPGRRSTPSPTGTPPTAP